MREHIAPLAPGMRQTLPRRLVWEALSRLGPHCTAEEIASDLDVRRLQLPRSSVYRALDALTASGAVRVAHFGGGAARYELATKEHQRALCHAICSTCHGVLHLEESLIQELEARLERDHRFAAVQTEVVVVGVCAHCAGRRAVVPPHKDALTHA